MKNIEIKAHCPNFDSAIKVLKTLDALFQWTKTQKDSYFLCNTGKLKLRQAGDVCDELIFYKRPDELIKTSEYFIYKLNNSDELCQVLGPAIGTDLVVLKERSLYLWENVRIHLDDVTNLGKFIEFEAVVSEQNDEKISRTRVEFLKKQFNIKDNELITIGYYDMLNGRKELQQANARFS